jgi:hypothetical protein
LSGRNAIYLDETEVSLFPNEIKFRGEINSSRCSNITSTEKFIKYELTFKSIVKYECCLLDYYNDEKLLKSSFDEVLNSEMVKMNSLEVHKHYIFATYDQIFEILATGYELILTP